MWWVSGFELVFLRKPTLDDFIVPCHARDLRNHTKSSAYKLFRRACALIGVEAHSLHSTRHTFITVARRNRARMDVLEKITHNAEGKTIDTYTHWEWEPLCQAVLCFTVNPSTGHRTDPSRPPDSHSKSLPNAV